MRPTANKPVVLSVLGAYWPGNDSSGPIKSFKAASRALGDEFEFRLLARNASFGATGPKAPDDCSWSERDGVRVCHLPVGRFGAIGLRKAIRDARIDALWLNGFFDREFTIPILALRRLGLIPPLPTIISPRGEFGAGALALKGARKRIYANACRALGMIDDVALHATSDVERQDFLRSMPWLTSIHVAPNIAEMAAMPTHGNPSGDGLQLAFVGRISAVKNLDFAIRALAIAKAQTQLNLYGPIQDAEHWKTCERLIAELPDHISVRYMGEIPNDEVSQALLRADLLFLPTRGENFGHAIFEALASGVPVLISDQTPWRDLQADGAGWDLPLSDPRSFAAAIDSFALASDVTRESMRKAARAKAERWLHESSAVDATRNMLLRVLSR